MKLIVIKNKKARLNLLIDWLMYMTGYTFILIIISMLFKHTIYIDSSFYGIWGFISSIIIYLLNKTIKPIIVWMTLPLTGLTFGLFYPFVNVLILNITDFLLGNHFNINGLLMSFFVAILISLMNFLLQEVIIKKILRGVK